MSESENRNVGEIPPASPITRLSVLRAQIAQNKMDFVLLCTRVATIAFIFNYCHCQLSSSTIIIDTFK